MPTETLPPEQWLSVHIRDRRQALSLTQRKLAEISGTTTSYICKLEQGEHVPTLRVLAKVFTALQEDLLIGYERIEGDQQHSDIIVARDIGMIASALSE